MPGSNPPHEERNLYLNKLKVFFYNIIIVGFQTDTTIQIPKQYHYTYNKAIREKNPLILLLVPDPQRHPGRIGPDHAVVMVPGDGKGVAPVIYDNHYSENSSYKITNIVLMGPMKPEFFPTYLSRIVSLISQYVSFVYPLPESVTEEARRALEKVEFHPSFLEIFSAKDGPLTQTTFQDLAPGKGICLYSALIIYIELIKKKQPGHLPQLSSDEIGALKATCSKAAFEQEKIDFFTFVLLPQVESYEPADGTTSLPASGAAAEPELKRARTAGGKKKTKRKRKTKRKMKNKKRKNRRKTKRRRKRKSRK